jgi:hypothetical protein
MAIAYAQTINQARDIIKDALAEMPSFLGQVSPADLENLVTELLPPHE